MNRFTSTFAVFGMAALMVLCVPQMSEALGVRVKAGVDLTREQQFDTFRGFGGQFDSHRWMLGSNLDLGAFILPKLHLVPGVDLAIQENLRVYVINLDANYFFFHSPRGRGYAGIGFGTHLYRPNAEIETAFNDTKISLNLPLGYQRKLGAGLLAWFGEMKLVIADDEKDSALQFSIGLNFGL